MEKFIRIDLVGHWKGREHRSSQNGLAGEWDHETKKSSWEDGISCYSLKNKSEGIENLRQYWYDIARFTTASRFEGMQVTIFEGKKIGMGSDWEDIATCEKTIAELDAVEFMGKVFEAYERFEDEEITEEEYNKHLKNLINFDKPLVKANDRDL
ncbi:hypothetical protein NST12_16510 [Bacillus sp. FSL W8-1127]|uniref:hypothetical protein n=1 Tax=Bacillus sp. FSL W8-1127 TaxID=2954710 RepID=UPI0030F92956